MKILSCADSERGFLSGLIRYGSFAYHGISDLSITDNTFIIDSHKVIIKCLIKIFKENDNIIPDVPLIYSAASDIGLKSWFLKDNEVAYLDAIMNFPVQENNIRTFALKIKKLEWGRNVIERLNQAHDDTLNITGNESITDIFGILEKSIIDCSSLLSTGKSAVNLSEGIEEYFLELEKNPVDQIGISSGFPVYDSCIGGGLRSGTVNVIAARSKQGKSTLALNIAMHIANLDIPVLYLDSEMSKEDSWHRMVACLSQINSREIETGKYSLFMRDKYKVDNAIQKLKTLPIYYESIAGQPLENQISSIKRWLITEVGLKKDGTAKQCVIIYDYIKLMNEGEGKGYQEYQAIGFLMTSLVNFARKYSFPILGFIQTNRDGINKEDASTIAQSDRVVWFCSSLAIFKAKTQDEINLDGITNGNRKLIVTDARFGPGLMDGDYINCNFNKGISKITEGKTRFELIELQKQKKIMNQSNDQNVENEPISF